MTIAKCLHCAGTGTYLSKGADGFYHTCANCGGSGKVTLPEVSASLKLIPKHLFLCGHCQLAATKEGWVDETAADHALRAAAGDLRDALVQLLAHEGEVVLSGIGTEHDSEALEKAKALAHAALAKAARGVA